MDYVALKNEIQNDPAALYSGQMAAGNDTGLATLLNAPRSGTSADGKSYSLFRNDIAPKEIIDAIQPVDFAALTQIQLSKMNLLFQSAPIDATLSGVRQNFRNIFSGSATLLSGNLTGISQRNGSRAEVLFGVGVAVNSTDVAKAFGRV